LNPNPQQVIQVSKDWNCSLVSNKNFSEILLSSSLGTGPGERGQKVLHLWHHLKKLHP